jgi:hypothetical protein
MYTTEQIVETFEESSLKVAEFISLLADYRDKFDWISNQTMDNADPVCDAAECLESLGCLLASCVIYSNEYLKEGNKENES